MRRKQLVLILSLLTISCLSGCGKDKVDPTEPSPLETIAPETKSDLISDKLDEPDDYTIQTIGTTEAVINSDGDIATVGITETLEDNTFIGVTPSGDLMVTMNVPELSSKHEYTESEALAVEGLQAYWKNNNISEEVLRQRLSDEVFSGLSETDKEEIISDIISSDPHPNPEITKETEPESTENSDLSDTEKQIEDLGMSNEELTRWFQEQSGAGIGSGIGNGTGSKVQLRQ